MRYTVETLPVGDHTAHVFVPNTSGPLPVIYVNASDPQDVEAYAPPLFAAMGKTISPALLVCVTPTDWNADFSPWPGPGIYAATMPFPGKGDARVELLVHKVKPAVDAAYNTLPDAAHTGVFGYSLGGLAALYATLCHPEVFGLCGCLSGSLWYFLFDDFLKERVGGLHGQRIYLSLGRKEAESRNSWLAGIRKCQERTYALLAQQLGEENVTFVLHNGGHSTEVPRRMLSGLTWLLAPRA